MVEAWTNREDPLPGEDGRPARPSGLYFRSRLGPVIRDVYGTLISAAHRAGLMVFAVAQLRRADWLDPNLGWTLQAYDDARRLFRPVADLDLLHPAYQEFLVGLLTDLAATGVDGILLQTRGTTGPAESVSPFGVRGFERDFKTTFDPTVASSGKQDGERRRSSAQWKWLGWATRATHAAVARVVQGLRTRTVGVQVILEVSQESVVDPGSALIRFGEDFLEARRTGYDAFATVPSPASAQSLIERMQTLAGGPERVWIVRPLRSGGSEQAISGVPTIPDRGALGNRVGLFYAVDGVAVP